MRHTFTKATIGAVLITAIMAMTPATAGPPWISIEYPPSPHDRTTRDAFLLVHAFHHGTPVNFPVAGRAIGLVNGEKRAIKLAFTTTSREGVYALRKQWPAEGSWVLAIDVTQQGNSKAGALVELSSSGDVAKVTVPTSRQDGWSIPRAISGAEIDAALASRVRLASSGTGR